MASSIASYGLVGLALAELKLRELSAAVLGVQAARCYVLTAWQTCKGGDGGLMFFLGGGGVSQTLKSGPSHHEFTPQKLFLFLKTSELKGSKRI